VILHYRIIKINPFIKLNLKLSIEFYIKCNKILGYEKIFIYNNFYDVINPDCR
jgi:hypothetical protein